MSISYPIQTINTAQKRARISFSEDHEHIEDSLKLTPMVFCFTDDKVVLSFDKTNEWNAQCGHRNDGESVEECIKREAYEEAGVTISLVSEFGHMKYETDCNMVRKYPPVTYIPVFIATVDKIDTLPGDSEVKEVIVADHKTAITLLSARNDNKLLVSIYEKCRKRYFSNEGK